MNIELKNQSNQLHLLAMGLFAALFLLFPVKLFKHGDIQLAHYATTIFSLVVLASNFEEFKSCLQKKPFKYLALFSLWTIIVNAYYAFTTGHAEFLIDAAMYTVYSFFSIAVFILLSKQSDTANKVFIYSCLSVMIPICIYVLYFNFTDSKPRATFNNKNQLSQWCFYIALFALFFHTRSILKFKDNKFLVLILSLVTATIIIGITRATIGGILLLLGLSFFKMPKLIGLVAVCTVLLLSVHYYFSPKNVNQNIRSFENKFLVKKNKYDTFLGRGYWRVIEFPKYVVLGAGERLHEERFNDRFEIHSSYGNILFSYGIVGLALLFCSYFHFFKIIEWDLLLVLPILFISLFHSTLRLPFTWMFPIFYYYYTQHKHNIGHA